MRLARPKLVADAGHRGRRPRLVPIQAQLPDVTTVQENSRVRVGDVNVGTVTKIERQGWHALITMTINGDVMLPADATATVGQTSLFGSTHVELAAPTDTPPKGRLRDGSVIPLDQGRHTPPPNKHWPRSRCYSTAVASGRFRTSPRRSARHSPAVNKICAA